jgi:RNA polymerase II-associated factor 1
MRYARPEFLNALANDMPLPMIVDAECGMPLDLGKWESLWLGEETDTTGGDIKLRWPQLDAELNPDPYDLPVLDPEDAALLAELAPATPAFGNSQLASGPSTPLPAHVPWLRKTEYISREGVQRSGAHEPCVPFHSIIN